MKGHFNIGGVIDSQRTINVVQRTIDDFKIGGQTIPSTFVFDFQELLD